jgi:alkylation response protein AidB-like acyl-CoA dehydrogenase
VRQRRKQLEADFRTAIAMHWTVEQTELRESATTWGRRVGERALEREEHGDFDWDAWATIRQSGLLSVPFEEAYGGMARDLSTTLGVLEAFGYGCEDAGLSFAMSTHLVSTGIALTRFASDAQKQRYLPRIVSGEWIGAHAITEPAGGSDAFSMKSRAVRCERSGVQGWCLSGSKTFISNAPIANLLVVYAVTDPAKSALGGVTPFLLERDCPGLVVGKPIATMGLKSAPLAEVFFDDCFVQDDQMLGKEGLGFAIIDYVMKWEILLSFGINLGEMQRRMEQCIAYAKTRRQFGQNIGSFQAVSHKLADMKIKLETARMWLYRTAEKFQKGQNVSLDLAITKILASESNVETALDAIQIFGGYGYMKEYGLERGLRDAVAGKIYSGTSEIQRNRIARLIGL